MFSLKNFPQIEALRTLPEVRGVVVYGGIGRGDEKTKDADFLIFTKGKKYVTPISAFNNLLSNGVDPTITDVQIHSDEELDGVLCRLFKPSSYDHIVSNGKVVFPESWNPIEKLRKNKDIWYKVSDKTGIRTHYLLELSEELTSIRAGYLWIEMFMPQRKHLGKDSRKSFIKTLNGIRGTAIMREGLSMKGIHLGKSDKGKNITNRFFDEYPMLEEYRQAALEIRDFEPREHKKLSNRELTDIMIRSKEIGERCVHTIDQEIMARYLTS